MTIYDPSDRLVSEETLATALAGVPSAVEAAQAAATQAVSAAETATTMAGQTTAIQDDAVRALVSDPSSRTYEALGSGSYLVAGAITTSKLSATAIDGMTVTGATVQTSTTAATTGGVVMNADGLRAYNTNGAKTCDLNGSDNFLSGTFATSDSGERVEIADNSLIYYDRYGDLAHAQYWAASLSDLEAITPTSEADNYEAIGHVAGANNGDYVWSGTSWRVLNGDISSLFTAGNNWTLTSFKATVSGNLVHVRGVVTRAVSDWVNAPIWASAPAILIPEGYRPSVSDINVPAVSNSSVGRLTLGVQINSESIAIRVLEPQTLSVGGWVGVSVTYPIA